MRYYIIFLFVNQETENIKLNNFTNMILLYEDCEIFEL